MTTGDINKIGLSTRPPRPCNSPTLMSNSIPRPAYSLHVHILALCFKYVYILDVEWVIIDLLE